LTIVKKRGPKIFSPPPPTKKVEGGGGGLPTSEAPGANFVVCTWVYNVVLFKTNPKNPKTYVNNTIFKLIYNFEKIQIRLTQKLAGQSQQLVPITAIPRI
jgi:hypothetical protein